MATATPNAQPDQVWLRSTSLGEVKAFSPAHAAALQATEEAQGHHDWLPTDPPAAEQSPSTDSTPPPADDSTTRKRSGAAKKPRQRRGD